MNNDNTNHKAVDKGIIIDGIVYEAEISPTPVMDCDECAFADLRQCKAYCSTFGGAHTIFKLNQEATDKINGKMIERLVAKVDYSGNEPPRNERQVVQPSEAIPGATYFTPIEPKYMNLRVHLTHDSITSNDDRL